MIKKNCFNKNIRLTPRDIFKYSHLFHMSQNEFIDKYCELYIKNNFPYIILKQNYDSCLFWNQMNKCCDLKNRPDACTVPYGNYIWFGETISSIPQMEQQKIENDLLIKDDFYNTWIQTIAIIELLINKIKNKSDIHTYIHMVYINLYFNYELNYFLPQFETKKQEIIQQLSIFF